MATTATTAVAAIKSFLCIKIPPSFYRRSAGGLAAGGVVRTGKNTGDKLRLPKKYVEHMGWVAFTYILHRVYCIIGGKGP
jgi:hypothetical protein